MCNSSFASESCATVAAMAQLEWAMEHCDGMANARYGNDLTGKRVKQRCWWYGCGGGLMETNIHKESMLVVKDSIPEAAVWFGSHRCEPTLRQSEARGARKGITRGVGGGRDHTVNGRWVPKRDVVRLLDMADEPGKPYHSLPSTKSGRYIMSNVGSGESYR